MRSSAKGKDLTTKAQTLTSLSHWSASQSQFHHHGREESLRLKFNTLKYQLSKPEPKFCLKKKQSFWETSFSTGSFPFACASFQVIIHAPIPRRVIDGYASKWHFWSQLKMTKNEKKTYMCLVVIIPVIVRHAGPAAAAPASASGGGRWAFPRGTWAGRDNSRWKSLWCLMSQWETDCDDIKDTYQKV